MKQNLIYIGLMISIIFFVNHCTQQKDFPVLTGPYFGQKPPEMTPKVFEPKIVSTGFDELNSVFSPDEREFYFCIRNFSGAVSIFQMKMEGENWSQPKLLPFASRYGDIDVTISPDENKILFNSRRPISGSDKPKEDYDFWMVKREGNTWGEPIYLGEEINSTSHDYYPMMTKEKMFKVVEVTEANKDLFDAIDANLTIMEALGNSVYYTEDLFKDFTSQAVSLNPKRLDIGSFKNMV